MKKFLSLVLALIMTMSLVTISAGATEYKELTDKDEIQYEEAVAVLNRIGVITGYSDGSFRPETELTRGAAAKIIVSLLIGPEAASNLPNTFAPYPDVPANHTFAGVISYCKTAGIISGYGDGTFKPGNSLTGYAFAKMLLGAIGYDSKIQGYTDTGWTMNVARDGNAANLFNRIEFDGSAAVNREQACQLALNTLKATMVEYSGGLNITAGDAHVTSAPTLTYKTSNQSYAKNISNRKLNTAGNVEVNAHWTVEFGEEHFKDLRLNDEHGSDNVIVTGRTGNNVARDDFGRPSNVWSYKKVTIGTFPIEADFVYTTQVIHNDDSKVTDAAKVRALELNGYELKLDASPKGQVDTALYLNGELWEGDDLLVENDNEDAKNYSHYLATVGSIADYTDNGTRVEVYVDEDDADWINTVVVVKTQLMEVKSLKSEAVSLKLYDDGSDDKYMGFNSTPINEDVNDVQINDDCYDALKDMKVGDIVAVIPVWTGLNSKYDVAKVYVPETVSGELTNVDTYGQSLDDGEEEAAIATTVGGTDYKVALWNKDLTDIDGTKIRVTRKDVTLHLDEYGNALLATDVGSTSNFMVVGGYHSGLVDGKVVTFVDGWDIKGNEISLNIGNIQYTGVYYNDLVGQLVHYSSDTHSKYAEWDIDYLGVFDVASKRPADDGSEAKEYSLKASSSKVLLNGWTATGNNTAGADTLDIYKGNDVDGASEKFIETGKTFETKNIDVDDSGVKVIYVTMDTDDNEVDSIEIKDGMQAISNEEILGAGSGFTLKRAQACVALKNDNREVRYTDSTIKAIVIKLESGSANLKDLVYISNYIGSAGVAAGKDSTSKPVYGYEAHFVGSSDYDKTVTIYSYKDLRRGDFARARLAADAPTEVKNVTEENFYSLTKYGDTVGSSGEKIHKALSVLPFAQIQDILSNNKTLIKLTNYDDPTRVDNGGIVTYAAKATEITNVAGQANITLSLNDVSELDLGDTKANSIVSINKAKFIDLTDNNVDSASDLKDLWNDVTDAQKKAHGDNVHRLINLTLLFNDKYDDDGFRDVHAVIITSAPKSAVYTVKGGQELGDVKFSGDATKGTDYTTDPADVSTKKSGDSFLIKPADGKKITVANGTGYSAVEQADGSWKVTLSADKVTVEVNLVAENTTNVKFEGNVAKMNGAGIGFSGARVATDGKVVINLNLEAPDWASTGGNAKMSVTVDGKPAGTISSCALTLSGSTLTGTDNSITNVPQGSEVEVTITEITYTKVKIQVMEGTTDVTKKWTVPADIAVGTSANNIAVNTVEYASTDSTSANAPTAKVTGGVKSEAALAMTFSINKWTNAAATVDVKGDGPVVITVDTSKLVPSYTITLNDGTGAAPSNDDGKNITNGSLALSDWGITTTDSAAKVTVAGANLTVKEGVPFSPSNITVKLGTAATSGYEYTVTIPKLGNAKAVITNTSGTNTVPLSVGTVALTEDMLITADDIQIECTKQPLAVDASKSSWTGTTMTIAFNQKVDEATATDVKSANTPYTFVKGGLTATPVIGDAVLSDDGTTVTLIFADAELEVPATGDAPKVTIDGSEIEDTSGTAFGALTADDVSIAAGGTVSVA